MRTRPHGLMRFLFRIPLLIYRLHLGFLLGHRFLKITHVGRRTKRTRQTVVEVVQYTPASRESVVASAWGERSDWLRNIEAFPALLVESGGDRYVPVHRVLSPDEAFTILQEYQRKHPRLIAIIPRFLGLDYDGTPESLRRFGDGMRLVAFRPAGDRLPDGYSG